MEITLPSSGTESASQNASLTVNNWNQLYGGIETFEFGSQLSLDVSKIEAGYAGTSSDDVFSAWPDDDTATISMPYLDAAWINLRGGNDILRSSGRDHVIIGGRGDDLLIMADDRNPEWRKTGLGHSGAHFIFAEDHGHDTIQYFWEEDTIVFDIDDLLFSDLIIEADGNDVVITYDEDDTIRLLDTDISIVTEDVFDFIN